MNLASKISYLFFSTPFNGKLKINKLPQILKKAQIKTHTINHLKYTSYSWLNGEKSVLLIHGWESNSSRWETLIEKFLSTNYSVFAIDAPAHGLSKGKRFNIFDHAACIEDFQSIHKISFVVGHSIGGTSVMYHLTHTNQKYIEKVVILGAPSEFKVLIENFANTLKLNLNIYNHLINYLNNKYKYPILNFSIAEFCKSLQIEGKIFHDENDDVIALNEGQLIHNQWKNSSLKVTNGLGHSMQDEQVYDEILKFF